MSSVFAGCDAEGSVGVELAPTITNRPKHMRPNRLRRCVYAILMAALVFEGLRMYIPIQVLEVCGEGKRKVFKLQDIFLRLE